MIQVVLVEPEIPPNTGNIIRLCANTGAILHLIKPLGFPLDDARMKRAGLDYHEYAQMKVHESWQDFLDREQPEKVSLYGLSTKGHTTHSTAQFKDKDYLVFGPETRGLSQEIRDQFLSDRLLRLPMRPESRSLNLSNAVAIVVYEAWRQLGYEGHI